MDITYTALAVLGGALLGGYGLRTLIRAAGRRWLHLGTETVAVMGGIAFWGMSIGRPRDDGADARGARGR